MIALALRSVHGTIAYFFPTSHSHLLLPNSKPPSELVMTSPSSPVPQPRPFLLERLTAIFFWLLPSFVQQRLRPRDFKRRRLYPTSWLDGLRGVASFFVFSCHYTEQNVPWYTARAYGMADDADYAASSPLQLPFLRVVFSGRPMVHIFFVISGYVLSLKALKLVRKQDYAGLQRTLSSSVFRRGFRLFVPITASTLMIMVMIRLGWMGSPLPTLREQLLDWGAAVWAITFSWDWDKTQYLPYDMHLWTIPIEFSNSLLLFVVLTGVSRMKTYLRLGTVSAIMMYCLRCGHWAAFEFLGGMLLAEIGLIQEARHERAAGAAVDNDKEASDVKTSDASVSSPAYMARCIFKIILVGNMVFGLYVAGWPNEKPEVTPGISRLWRNTMEPFKTIGGDHVSFPWYALGALQIAVALQQIKGLRKIFLTPQAQYLGDISYALYLVHGPMLDVVASRWMPHVWASVGGRDESNMLARLTVWTLGIVTLTVPVVWCSDIFWRTVDVKSVELAHWVESKCTRNDE